MSDEQEMNCRAVWTKSVVDNVDGVPFVNLGTDEKPECVSAPVTEERMTRWRRFGYGDFTGDVDAVDRLLAESRQKAAAQDEADKQTIASLEDSNRRLSEDLVAARRKLRELTDADQTGAAGKIAELTSELDRAMRRIADLESGAGGGAEAGEQVAALQQQLDAANAKIAELQNIPADQVVVEEILRIAGLDKGFKKELEALAERLTAPSTEN